MVSTRNRRKTRKQRGGEGNSNLPVGWNMRSAEDGNKYFYHVMTNRYKKSNDKPTVNSEIKHYKNRKSTYDPKTGLAVLNSHVTEYGSLNAAILKKMERIGSLPSGWLELTSPEGDIFYFNPSTDKRSNTVPTA
jgi:hypothetical protein